jgi:hypothetical protein
MLRVIALKPRPHFGTVGRSVGHAGRQQQVYAKWPIRHGANRADPAPYLVRIEPGTAKETHSTSLADGCHKRGRGCSSLDPHAGKQDRILDTEVPAQLRA